jgi:hypothetical protein
MKLILKSDLPKLNFSIYRKTALTQARLLTQADYEARAGFIQTLEGALSFEVGDYLARGSAGEEWPVRATTILATKIPVSQPDAQGWVAYATATQVQAVQILEPFQVYRENGELFSGKAGDYLIDDGTSQWIVDQEIFKATYTPLTP